MYTSVASYALHTPLFSIFTRQNIDKKIKSLYIFTKQVIDVIK
jgi:hypothetical protein